MSRAQPIDLKKLIAMPSGEAMAALNRIESDYVEINIQPYVTTHFLGAHERIDIFEVDGDGLDKRLRWWIAAGDECEGCYGSGTIQSHRGTLTDCPDCDGAGTIWAKDGETREIVTDYDGEELLEGESRGPLK